MSKKYFIFGRNIRSEFFEYEYDNLDDVIEELYSYVLDSNIEKSKEQVILDVNLAVHKRRRVIYSTDYDYMRFG